MMQKKVLSEPVLDPLTNNSRTGWSRTISRPSRFRELQVHFFCCWEGVTLSTLCSTRETKASSPITTKPPQRIVTTTRHPPPKQTKTHKKTSNTLILTETKGSNVRVPSSVATNSVRLETCMQASIISSRS